MGVGTDDLGCDLVEDKVHVHDLHATILHCLGLDHDRLGYRHQGRGEPPTRPYTELRMTASGSLRHSLARPRSWASVAGPRINCSVLFSSRILDPLHSLPHSPCGFVGPEAEENRKGR